MTVRTNHSRETRNSELGTDVSLQTYSCHEVGQPWGGTWDRLLSSCVYNCGDQSSCHDRK